MEPSDYTPELTEAQWEQVDANIFANHKFPVFIFIRSKTGCGLHDSLRAFISRYDILRERSPEKFTMSHEDYWEGFDS